MGEAAAEAAAEADPAFVKTQMQVGTVRISSNMLALTTGTPPGLFPTARSCVDNAAAVPKEVMAMGISRTQGAPRRTTPMDLFARGKRGRRRRTARRPGQLTTARDAGR